MENCSYKTCSKCNLRKPLEDFRFRQRSEDSSKPRQPYSQCRACEHEQAYVLKELKKEATPKPEYCDCCGKYDLKLRLDHCHESWAFRGWLCQNCNVGISRLGDNIEGLQKAINYLTGDNHV